MVEPAVVNVSPLIHLTRAGLLGFLQLTGPVLEDLRRTGMYLSDRVLDAALVKVGE